MRTRNVEEKLVVLCSKSHSCSLKFVGLYSCSVSTTQRYWQIPTSLDTPVNADDPITQRDMLQNNFSGFLIK